MTHFDDILGLLVENDVEFILIGGLAGVFHGSSRVTEDVDIVYNRSTENIRRLVAALSTISPYLRGAPPGLPFFFDERAVQQGLNFTLTTDLGSLDLLGEMTGGGSYQDLIEGAQAVEIDGRTIQILSLSQLIRAKRAAGRPKDLEAIAELVALSESGD